LFAQCDTGILLEGVNLEVVDGNAGVFDDFAEEATAEVAFTVNGNCGASAVGMIVDRVAAALAFEGESFLL